jgi:hypothetical protein
MSISEQWYHVTETKRLLKRPRRRWVDNIKMDLGKKIFGGVDWIYLFPDRD